jgi:hypothetical protein
MSVIPALGSLRARPCLKKEKEKEEEGEEKEEGNATRE